jgi:hypothetical protein
VDPRTRRTLRAAERSVRRLFLTCRRSGPLYGESPQAVGPVRRTAQWLLEALATLRRVLGSADGRQGG